MVPVVERVAQLRMPTSTRGWASTTLVAAKTLISAPARASVRCMTNPLFNARARTDPPLEHQIGSKRGAAGSKAADADVAGGRAKRSEQAPRFHALEESRQAHAGAPLIWGWESRYPKTSMDVH
jgi:hypothetical protein